jgi:hypothetical protein
MSAALIGAAISGYGAYRANRQTQASTARQMAFQERMSNTAHQRQMADLKQSGINPMLSAKLGGASSPAGASYQASNIGAAAVEGYGKVSSAQQAQAQAKYTSGAQTEFTKQQTENAIQSNKNLKQAYRVAVQQVKNMEEKWFIDRLTGTIMNRDNNFYEAVSSKLGVDIGPQGVQSAKQAADIVLRGIAQGGDLAKFILNWKFKTPRGK